MKVRGDDTLEGAHSLSRFLRQISSFSHHFLETLTEMGSIHWVGVQTWMVRGDDILEKAHSFVELFDGISSLSGKFLENTYRDWFYTRGLCTSLAAKQSWSSRTLGRPKKRQGICWRQDLGHFYFYLTEFATIFAESLCLRQHILCSRVTLLHSRQDCKILAVTTALWCKLH